MLVRRPLALVFTASVLSLPGAAQGAPYEDIVRCSVTSFEQEASDDSSGATISSGGRYVAFDSDASDLVANDTNSVDDVFVRDTVAGTTTRVSVGAGFAQSNGVSGSTAISGDGRLVVFNSQGNNLVDGDTNSARDVFVRDLVANTTERVSVAWDGQQGDDDSFWPEISGNGHVVVFDSDAENLVPGDVGGVRDLFVRDLVAATTTRISVNGAGEGGDGISTGPAVSWDGRVIAFRSEASNLVAGDTNGSNDVFVLDRDQERLERVSVSSSGEQANEDSLSVAISANGRWVAFTSWASNLIPGESFGIDPDVFLHDRRTGATTRISNGLDGGEADGGSFVGSITADGRYVSFRSWASNLVEGDTNGWDDSFLADTRSGAIWRIGVSADGEEADEGAGGAILTPDGRFGVLSSRSSNLVPGDTNDARDVFLLTLEL